MFQFSRVALVRTQFNLLRHGHPDGLFIIYNSYDAEVYKKIEIYKVISVLGHFWRHLGYFSIDIRIVPFWNTSYVFIDDCVDVHIF